MFSFSRTQNSGIDAMLDMKSAIVQNPDRASCKACRKQYRRIDSEKLEQEAD